MASPLTTERESHAPGFGLEDVDARIRAVDQRYVVSYKFGVDIGLITPTRGRFLAHHFRNGDAGPFDSIGEAKRALWDLD